LPRRAVLVALGLGVLLVLAPAAPAGADAVRPGDTRSVVDRLSPPTPGVQVEVLGGDAFLQVTATRGTTVLVPGYSGEPYLRIRADGVVERNTNSPAVALNRTRLGSGTGDSTGDATAAPDWERIGSGGRVAWHDHRIHWMAPNTPSAAPGGVIQRWEVPLEVDGHSVTVHGRLLLVDPGFPWAAVVLVAVAAVVALVASGTGAQLAALAGAAVVAGGVATAAWRANPPEADARPWAVALALAALAAVITAAVLERRRSPRALVARVAAVALLAGWTAYQATALWAAVVPTAGPVWADRSGTALVAGITLGVTVRLVWPARRRPAVSAAGS
jgi:hypothetical protein